MDRAPGLPSTTASNQTVDFLSVALFLNFYADNIMIITQLIHNNAFYFS